MSATSRRSFKPLLLVAAGLFALWGILGIFDVRHQPYSGYQTDGNNTIIRVTDGSPAARAGLQTGDVLRRTGGISVEDAAAQARRPRPAIGETRTYEVERAGEPIRVALTYAALPASNRMQVYAAICIGFCFLVAGLWPFLRFPNRRTLVLATAGLCLGITFFGGPYLASYAARTLVGALTTVCVAVGFAALLHFTLLFPKPGTFLGRRSALAWIYGPAVLVGLFLLYRGLTNPPATSMLNSITTILVGLFIVVYFGLSLVGFVRAFATAGPGERSAYGLTYVLGGALAGFLPILFVMVMRLMAPQAVIPGSSYFFLTLVFIPITLALAGLKTEHVRHRQEGVPAS